MKLLRLLTLTCLAAAISHTAVAEWVLIDDFESTTGIEDYNVNLKFDNQGQIFIDPTFDQTDPGNHTYFADPGPSRDVGGNNQIWNSITLPEPIPEGGKGTLKYRVFFFESGPFNLNVGIGDVPIEIDETLPASGGQMIAPTDYAQFESQIGWTDKGIITVRNGNGFSDTIVPIPVQEWTTIYYLIDNDLDQTIAYYQGESMDSPEVIELASGATEFVFRNGTTDPLITLTFISAGSNSGPVSVFLLDDIYYDPDGWNLDGAPLPDGPTTWGGLLLDGSGDVDTGDWIGVVNATNAPWVFSYDFDTYFYIPDENVTEQGAWTSFTYQGSPPSSWADKGTGYLDTGAFMGTIYDSGQDWVFSYTLERWIYLPEAGVHTSGEWGYLSAKRLPLLTNDYLVPAMANTPLIDGIISDGEWSEANSYEHSYAALIETGIGTSWLDLAGSPQPNAPRPSADVNVAATKQGLYMSFDVTDDELTITNEYGTAGNNSDGVQVGLDMNIDPTNRDSTVLFDLNPASLVGSEATGPMNVYARWATDPTSYDVTWGVQAASEIHAGGYSIEVMIPWTFLNSFGISNPIERGTEFRLTVALLDQDAGDSGTDAEILWDSGAGVKGIGNAANYPTAAISTELFNAPTTYSVPKVSMAPTIDGTLGVDEYLMGSYTEASFENWVTRANGASRIGTPEGIRSEGGLYLAATDEALYMAAEISAPTISITTEFGTGSNNESGVQMAIGLDPNSTNRNDSHILWDFTAATLEGSDLTGPANIFGRWGISPGYDAGWGMEASGSFTDDGYIIEVKLPWDVLRNSVNSPVVNALEKGDVFNLSFIVVNVLEDGTVNELLVDFGDGEFTIGNPATWNLAVIRN